MATGSGQERRLIDPELLVEPFDTEAEAAAVLVRLRQVTGFVFGYGPGPSHTRPSLVEVPIDSWQVVHHHRDAIPPRTDRCQRCDFPQSEHGEEGER